jgi:23S rRNA U2552 (ribose-2'-O)-methylase RlmE/FtsJ
MGKIYWRAVMLSLSEIYQNNIKDHPYPSDKGRTHCYIDHYYNTALEPYRNTPNNVLEIGIHHGSCIEIWREYFHNANKIYGVDILDHGVHIDGCHLWYGDATKPETFVGLNNFDVIIDDGSHETPDQIETFKILWPMLNKGGIYIIEDVQRIDSERQMYLDLRPDVKIIDLRSVNNWYDDVLIEMIK